MRLATTKTKNLTQHSTRTLRDKATPRRVLLRYVSFLTKSARVKMNFKIVVMLCALFAAGCQSSDQLKPISKIKPSVANEGSLANEKLIADTTAGLNIILGESEVNSEAKILKFVIQQPVGKPSARAWREMWIVNPKAAGKQFIITFKETGLGAADFEIKPINLTPQR